MKPYGKKHTKKTKYCTVWWCCGRDQKEGLKRRERQHAKLEIKKELKDNEL